MEAIQSSSKITYRSAADVKSTLKSEPRTQHSPRTDLEDPSRECTTEPIQTGEKSIRPSKGRKAALHITDDFEVTNEAHARAREDQILRAFQEAARLVGVNLMAVSEG